MKVLRTPNAMREALAATRGTDRTVGLVPTMGALHDGHRSLLRAARERCDLVVMSLFVNPIQFGPGEDLAGYPAGEARDLRVAEEEGVDFAYAPAAGDVYPPG